MVTSKNLANLFVDIDANYQSLAEELPAQSQVNRTVNGLDDAEVLIDYLPQCRNRYADLKQTKLSKVVFLLRISPINGFYALRDIKADPQLLPLPTAVLTTSKDEEVYIRNSKFGVDSFITKPDTFQSLVHAMRTIVNNWLTIAHAPQTTV